ncbi:sensor histidine kinase [Paraclostridium sordellii]|uniref:sensor histidine kinase n=1 Tax=Paraclostridium sordellii TaxID=1505 RepID=UPI0005E9BFF2|nr:sensor histidine kinase [Paeniclostridium sordellii]CEO15062.1 sensor histidine kinase virs [[Clostridium] sordellii] [Paeniclostridium sordellii]CEP90025.1 sensor histidine kinase virs [[Clostridium] sordellii] [Paeniclostridium sordellii]CEP98375.1 sensor histidine kinase virs [[Clostridium] sordellii] [Paeniclostridium sordellii]CEQ02134.1 sensor histidine kinase virs [[Clostridium] sordellii] [Paeniclostridium sordellii]
MLEFDFISRVAIGISTFLQYFIFIKILDSLEERKSKKKYFDILFLSIAILDSVIIFNRATQYYELMNDLKWISFILFTKLSYRMSNFKIISSYFIYTISYYIIDNLVLTIVSIFVTGHTLYGEQISEKYLDIIFVVKNLIMIFVNMSYINIIKVIKNTDKEKVNIIVIIGCILSNFIIAFINSLPYFSHMRISNSVYNNLIIFNSNITPKLSFISSILLTMVVFKAIKNIKDKNEENLLKEKIDMQYNYYLNLQESQNKVKRLYHDMSNHIMCIKTMSSEQEDLNNYIDGISKNLNKFKEIYNTGNMILDIILNEKQAKCNENDISLYCDINFSKCNFIEMTDVCSIFSNIIDNAIEACNKINNGEKYIKIRGTVVKSYYVIRCENSKINKIKIKNNKIITSKKDKFIHGIGLKSVKSSLKKYDGELEIEDFESEFLLQIYIPINKNMTVGDEKEPVVL